MALRSEAVVIATLLTGRVARVRAVDHLERVAIEEPVSYCTCFFHMRDVNESGVHSVPRKRHPARATRRLSTKRRAHEMSRIQVEIIPTSHVSSISTIEIHQAVIYIPAWDCLEYKWFCLETIQSTKFSCPDR
jgi:hypothetical protein